ncbi:unnamed protein product [Linum trigynum]|uniref:Uncharacterized protein n=1 Tax=Linum trigynum TaxID=586398 RepID=A0AAV2ENL2_9ROSI
MGRPKKNAKANYEPDRSSKKPAAVAEQPAEEQPVKKRSKMVAPRSQQGDGSSQHPAAEQPPQEQPVRKRSKKVSPSSREGEGSRQPPARQQPEVEEEDEEEDEEGPCDSYFRFRGSTYSLFKVISYWKQDVAYYAA